MKLTRREERHAAFVATDPLVAAFRAIAARADLPDEIRAVVSYYCDKFISSPGAFLHFELREPEHFAALGFLPLLVEDGAQQAALVELFSARMDAPNVQDAMMKFGPKPFKLRVDRARAKWREALKMPTISAGRVVAESPAVQSGECGPSNQGAGLALAETSPGEQHAGGGDRGLAVHQALVPVGDAQPPARVRDFTASAEPGVGYFEMPRAQRRELLIQAAGLAAEGAKVRVRFDGIGGGEPLAERQPLPVLPPGPPVVEISAVRPELPPAPVADVKMTPDVKLRASALLKIVKRCPSWAQPLAKCLMYSILVKEFGSFLSDEDIKATGVRLLDGTVEEHEKGLADLDVREGSAANITAKSAARRLLQ